MSKNKILFKNKREFFLKKEVAQLQNRFEILLTKDVSKKIPFIKNDLEMKSVMKPKMNKEYYFEIQFSKN